MFYSTAVIAAAAFSGLVAAQSTNETGTGPQINAGSVDYTTRQTWCRIQTQTCPQLCNGPTEPNGNNCDPNTLTYSCVCSATGNSPNVSDYQQTLPAYVCREYIDQCVNAHPNDLEGITTCRDTQCGNKTVDQATSSSSSESATASATSSTRSGSGSAASQTASSSGSDSSATATESGAGATATGDSAASALNIASNYGTGILAAGILAAFGLAL